MLLATVEAQTMPSIVKHTLPSATWLSFGVGFVSVKASALLPIRSPCRDGLCGLPRIQGNKNSGPSHSIVWRSAEYMAIISILRNPLYAGAYVFGRNEARTRVVDGKAKREYGVAKPRERWTVLLRDHHAGYITWDEYERNQQQLAENTYMKQTMGRKSGRGGRGLLAGLLRCARCGRMLHVEYILVEHMRYASSRADSLDGRPSFRTTRRQEKGGRASARHGYGGH